MDHDKTYKPAYQKEMPAKWIDNFFEQVNKDMELIRLSEIMKSISSPPQSTTITIRPQDLFPLSE